MSLYTTPQKKGYQWVLSKHKPFIPILHKYLSTSSFRQTVPPLGSLDLHPSLVTKCVDWKYQLVNFTRDSLSKLKICIDVCMF